ncbi:PD-(D/E)XK nuclease family protein [Burkholderia sp. Ed8]|uniref:PDDEXK-like family protein n=1 Tax=Burkholderia sp. Ed8 TaxID=3112957 RepID=UPI00345D9AD9
MERIEVSESEPEPNFFSIGGSGYLENPTSDLLALFMGAEPSTPRWLAKALVSCLARQGHVDAQLFEGVDWTKVRAKREVAAWDKHADSTKRLDLVVSDGNFALGIENKVYASAAYNPFRVYDELLKQTARGGPILRCILRATTNRQDLPLGSDWPVVSYSDLVDAALSQYGTEVAFGPVTKWPFFYREFLFHLRSLSEPLQTLPMNEENINFAIENLPNLLKAADLLNQLEDGLRNEGEAAIKRALLELSVETTIRTGVSNWGNGEKALRFYPHVWGGQSQVVLVYLPDTEHKGNRSIRFYVNAYIERDTTRIALDELQERFERETMRDQCSWKRDAGDTLTWFESNRRLLAFSAWARDESKTGALSALADLATWIHRNAFA